MDRIHQSFARQGFMTLIGAELTLVAPGQVTITAPLRPETCQQQGFAHGAIAFGIGDSASGYAAVTLLDDAFDVVTSDMTIHYLAPGLGTRLIARGRVIRPGRRMLVTEANVFAEDAKGSETHIARLTGTMVRVPLRT